MNLSILLMLTSALAQEPGQLSNELPQGQRHKDLSVLTTEFAQARGLSAAEIRGMHYNRVACGRRVFTPNGRSLEGDGDLKVTRATFDLYEIEFPSHITFTMFGALNHFRNGVADIDATASRQLINLKDWVDGQSLILSKYVTVYFEDEAQEPHTAMAVSEVKVLRDHLPALYIVRETIFTDRKFSYYYLCE